jgi:hypothetical protein
VIELCFLVIKGQRVFFTPCKASFNSILKLPCIVGGRGSFRHEADVVNVSGATDVRVFLSELCEDWREVLQKYNG